MSFWPGFWTVFLLLTVIVFAGMAVVVAVGGFFDLKAMFRQLEKQQRRDRE